MAVVAGAGFWAGRVALVPESSTAGATETDRVVERVVEASIGRAVTYNVTVSQPFDPVGVNALSGVVTAVRGQGRVISGEEIYAVSAVGVHVLEGRMPFYRALASGQSGRDVRQLQDFLVGDGYLDTADGSFGAATAAAVRSWQRATGAQVTGTVPFGTLVAVPDLPAPLRLGDGIRPGALLAGGELAVSARSTEPIFAISLTAEQAAEVPATATARVTFDDVTWDAIIARTQVEDEGTVSLFLTAPDGGVVCGERCSRLPPEPAVSLLSTVNVTPTVTGPAVPAAAVRTDESGSSYVTSPDGTRVPVTVRGSGDGVAVVRGVTIGDEVVVLGAAATNGQQ